MWLKVLRINAEFLLQLSNGITVLALQEVDSAQVIACNADMRILRQHSTQIGGRFIVLAFGAQHAGKEVVSACQIGLELQRLIQDLAGALPIAVPNSYPAEVDPSARVPQLHLSNLFQPL